MGIIKTKRQFPVKAGKGAGTGVPTWRLLLIVIITVLLGLAGGYSWQWLQSYQNSTYIDYGFETPAEPQSGGQG